MTTLGDLQSGFGLLFRGMGLVLRRRRLALVGMLPPIFVSALMIALIAVLGIFGLGPLTEMATGWVPEALRTAARVFLGIVMLALAVVVAVVLFVSITLTVGAPIYERISIAIESEVRQPAMQFAEPVVAGILRSIRQSATIVILSALVAGLLFLLGFIPVVGTILSLVLGSVVGGYFLVFEMTSGPFDRWGLLSVREKVRGVNTNRAKAIGFGLPVFLLFSIPILSIVLFPAATAGATLLAHDLDRARVRE